MIFKKYEFKDEETYLEARKAICNEDSILLNDVSSLVELGHICLETDEEGLCINKSTTYAVDILWRNEIESFAQYEVYPDPIGIHTFAGQDANYLAQFCLKNPDSPYCLIPDGF